MGTEDVQREHNDEHKHEQGHKQDSVQSHDSAYAHELEEIEKRAEIAQAHRPSKTALSAVLFILAAVFIANQLAAVWLSWLADNKPLWLILLNPITRNLLLVAHNIDPWWYFPLAIVRRMLPHVPWFFIGKWYGDRGIAWVTKRSPDIGVMIEWTERHFPRFGWLFCVLYPHPVVCAMAGAAGMQLKKFLGYTLAGITGFVVASYYFGDVLQPVTKPIVHFGGKYWLPITVISFALLGLSYALNRASEKYTFDATKVESAITKDDAEDKKVERDTKGGE